MMTTFSRSDVDSVRLDGGKRPAEFHAGRLLHVVFVLSMLGGAACQVDDQTPLLNKTASGSIDAGGGSVTLTDVAAATFPAGALGSAQTVTLATTHLDSTDTLWKNSTAIFDVGDRGVYELRVSIGTSPLASGTVTIDIVVPTILGKASAVGLFAEAIEGNDIEQMMRFVPVGATPANDRHLVLTLPSEYFFQNLESGDQFQAVVVITKQGPGGKAAASASQPKTGTEQQPLNSCPDNLIKLSRPLARLQKVRDFNLALATTIGQVTKGAHPGTDLVAADGTPVLAAGDGTVERVVDAKGTGINDNDGAGGMVVIKIPGSGTVTYMHLKQGQIQVKAGQPVKAGDVIALSDTSGFVTGPHLHFEFRPESDPNVRIDPYPCIDKGKVQTYAGTFQFSQDLSNQGGQHDLEAVSGTLQFDLDVESPGLASAGIRPLRHYALTAIDGAITTYKPWNDPQPCSITSQSPSLSIGELVIFTDTNTYAINLRLDWEASGSCPQGTFNPTTFTNDWLFGRYDSDFAAAVCAGQPNSIGADQQGSNFVEYPLVDSDALSDTYAKSCVDSVTNVKVDGRWSLTRAK